jgi:hypothetical protein
VACSRPRWSERTSHSAAVGGTAALEREDQPQRRRRRHRRGGPLLVDVEERRERLAGEDGERGDDHEAGEQAAHPARQRGGQLPAVAEPPERAFAGGRHLERGPGDESDHGQVEQRGERAVVLGAQEAGEDDRERDRDDVRGHGRRGEADGLPGLRILQPTRGGRRTVDRQPRPGRLLEAGGRHGARI